MGLSPHVRGNRPETLPDPEIGGSIPARAGEPSNGLGLNDLRRVYPRTCGGTTWAGLMRMATGGLSPHVRGNRFLCANARTWTGSIPARAGEPRDLLSPPCTSWVYPRTCGGTIPLLAGCASEWGLSPHVRGNPWSPAVLYTRHRSIPARAGEPPSRPWPRPSARVYPRTCGGTPRVPGLPVQVSGLSPHVRGNLRRPERHRPGRGSIPARAGEPM